MYNFLGNPPFYTLKALIDHVGTRGAPRRGRNLSLTPRRAPKCLLKTRKVFRAGGPRRARVYSKRARPPKFPPSTFFQEPLSQGRARLLS